MVGADPPARTLVPQPDPALCFVHWRRGDRAIATDFSVSVWRKCMYNLIWQSVMWRPGNERFLIGVKNSLHIRPTATPDGAVPSGIAPSPDSGQRSGDALPPSQIERPVLILIVARLSS